MAQLMKLRLNKLKAWKAIDSEPPKNHGVDEAPVVVEQFKDQYGELNLFPLADTATWTKRQWEVAYTIYKDEVKKYNEWEEKDHSAMAEIMERLTPHVQKEIGLHNNAKALWNALEEAYSTPLIIEQLRAFQALMSIKRSAFPDVRRYTTAFMIAYNHLTLNLRFDWDPKTLPTMMLMYNEATDSSSDWSRFLDKHRVGTKLDDPKQLITTLHGLEDQSSKVAKKPAAAPAPASVNVLQGKKRRNDSQGGRQGKQQKLSTCSECQKSHGLREGQVCWFKHPEKAPESWQKRHPDLLTK
ncbi:hypothetical protein GJ744_000907 [Endocarpon pusillum]|uniref:Uncharacterized protein n=1 Tax=Endocarpon pusillum TaxID=364733 RepID=A0A8H7ATD2_9EURO|nr:hypothetical protein GJ744_000907 [Endocarpon pusillum]